MPHDTTPLFDTSLLALRKQRALRQLDDDHLFLWDALTDRLVDRLDYVKRSFPKVLDISACQGKLAPMLTGNYGIEQVDEISELTLPIDITPYSYDLVVSVGSLQWANDLPVMLYQMLHGLKPDGLFIGILPGENTLIELRRSLDAVMLATCGGISPRISPMLSLTDAASLMQQAGFALPVVDREPIEVSYANPMRLLHDLRAMGQTNALKQRSIATVPKQFFTDVCDYYAKHFPHPEGGSCATFDIVTLTGWAPDKSQPKPLQRGSGVLSIKDVLDRS